MLLETRCVYAQCFFKDGTYLASSNYLFKLTLHTVPNILPCKNDSDTTIFYGFGHWLFPDWARFMHAYPSSNTN